MGDVALWIQDSQDTYCGFDSDEQVKAMNEINAAARMRLMRAGILGEYTQDNFNECRGHGPDDSVLGFNPILFSSLVTLLSSLQTLNEDNILHDTSISYQIKLESLNFSVNRTCWRNSRSKHVWDDVF